MFTSDLPPYQFKINWMFLWPLLGMPPKTSPRLTNSTASRTWVVWVLHSKISRYTYKWYVVIWKYILQTIGWQY
jgi:hypothetical protein